MKLLVTSHRQVIDDKGKELRHIYSTVRLFEEDTIIEGTELGNKVIVDQKLHWRTDNSFIS